MTKKIKLLYVDDEEMNLELFEYNFSEKYEVITKDSGLHGLEYMEKFPDVKVVFSDLKMPHMNGIEFIRKARECFKDKKYFVLSGYDISEELRKAIKSNIISGYFRKPFNISEIDEAIKEVV